MIYDVFPLLWIYLKRVKVCKSSFETMIMASLPFCDLKLALRVEVERDQL